MDGSLEIADDILLMAGIEGESGGSLEIADEDEEVDQEGSRPRTVEEWVEYSDRHPKARLDRQAIRLYKHHLESSDVAAADDTTVRLFKRFLAEVGTNIRSNGRIAEQGVLSVSADGRRLEHAKGTRSNIGDNLQNDIVVLSNGEEVQAVSRLLYFSLFTDPLLTGHHMLSARNCPGTSTIL